PLMSDRLHSQDQGEQYRHGGAFQGERHPCFEAVHAFERRDEETNGVPQESGRHRGGDNSDEALDALGAPVRSGPAHSERRRRGTMPAITTHLARLFGTHDAAQSRRHPVPSTRPYDNGGSVAAAITRARLPSPNPVRCWVRSFREGRNAAGSVSEWWRSGPSRSPVHRTAAGRFTGDRE